MNSKIIPIISEGRYSDTALLNDGSVVIPKSSVYELVGTLPLDEPITQLLHPEVRYEVTDHCNATCIMCPREEHEHGREHGIMNQDKYEKSIDFKHISGFYR